MYIFLKKLPWKITISQYLQQLMKLCFVATECVTALSVDSILQMQLLKAGALWHLLLFLFNYDFTLDEGGVEKNEEENRQEVSNRLAKEAVRACAALGGYAKDTPDNPVARGILEKVLSPYLANKLGEAKPEDILKVLNSNSETPYLVWNNTTRAELTDFLETQRNSREEIDLTIGSSFGYSAHEGELKIGEIFIRIYNQQPTYPIENTKGFTIDLLTYLQEQYQHLKNLVNIAYSTTIEDRLKHSQMALEALANVVKNNPSVEIQCIGHFRLLFDLLGVAHVGIQKGALSVISVATRNNECISDIAATEALGQLLLLLYSIQDSQLQVLDLLYALMSNTKIVKEALSKGAVIYLLDLFCNSTSSQNRERSAELLARMCADKLVGPKVKLCLGAFLPTIFADAMRDSPETAVSMFETAHEHPELVWDQEAKDRVCAAVAKMRRE